MSLEVVAIVLVALCFDFSNGFHDAANSIATVVSTRVLTPRLAVAWAAFFNFIAFAIFGVHVARTIAKGIVSPEIITPDIVLAALIGALAWNLLTWWLGLPTSSSHALIGGFVGAALVAVGPTAIIISGITKVIAFIVISPLLGLILGFTAMLAVMWICKRSTPARVDGVFRRLQLLSAAAFSLGHGSNDAQKTAGIITGVLFTSNQIQAFEVPYWVLMASYSAIALGTLSGGWRIVRTMGGRLTRLKPRSGFCAETGAAAAVLLSTSLGTPVSTTHAIAGAIAGVGSIQRMKAVRWGIAKNIVGAWVMTIPAAAIIAWLSYYLIHFTMGV